MPRFMFQASYTPQGATGLLKEGGTSRREALEKTIADHGGRIEAFYFTFGDDDVVLIAELPDQVTAAAIALRVSAAGGASAKTTVLLTPDEIDRAAHTTVAYRPPGA
jgi:uncharacterized protein with GYD domain